VVGGWLVGRRQAAGGRRQATGDRRQAEVPSPVFRLSSSAVRLRTPVGLALCAGGVLLAAATGLAYAYATTRDAPVGFGTLSDPGASPVACRLSPVACRLSPVAAGPPTRLVIARLGIATRVVALNIAGG